MPLSGEAIRMMNYIDDISTTLRRILALSPTLSADERKRVGEYLKASSPSADEAMAALNLNKAQSRKNLDFWNKQARKPVSG
jgi:hypothetical protein